MTSKRFKCVCMAEDLVEFQDNGIYKCLNDVELEKLLNALHEENQRLKNKLNFLNELNEPYGTLIAENQQLHRIESRLRVLIHELKAQLYCDDSVCNICNYQYLVESGKYYVAKCEKGYEQCSKEDVKYCEDFKSKKGDFE